MRFRKSILCLSALTMTFSLTAVASGANSPSVAASASQTYVVLYKTQSVSADAAAAVSKAGGSIVATYADIVPTVVKKADVNDILLKAIESALFNNVPAQTALDKAVADANKIIK